MWGGRISARTPAVNDVLTFQNNVGGINISLGNGNNTMNLAAGGNSFTNIFDINHVVGSGSNDTLTVTGAIAAVNGTTIDLGIGDDTLVLAGANTSFSAVGIEHISGNAADNSIVLNNNVDGIAIDLGGGSNAVFLANGANSVSLTNVGSIWGNDFGGAASDNSLTLLSTVDGVLINLAQGSNTLNLAAGVNTLGSGVFGLSFINGSATGDVLTMQGSNGNTIDLDDGTDTLNFTQSAINVTVANVENVNLSANFDTLIIGGNSTGITTVTAGVGADAITGSAGQDNFRFTSVGDSTINGARDTITSFDASIDTFTFAGIAHNGDHIEYIGTNNFSVTGLAQARYLTSTPGNDMLQIDLDGDGVMGAGDMEIGVASYTGNLSNSNFLLL